jgi:hypothetical protein
MWMSAAVRLFSVCTNAWNEKHEENSLFSPDSICSSRFPLLTPAVLAR